MSDVHVVDPIIRETRCDLNILLFHFQNKGEETLDICWRNVISV